MKLLIPFLIFLVTMVRKVIGKVPRGFSYDMHLEERVKLSRLYRNQGIQLYIAIPI